MPHFSPESCIDFGCSIYNWLFSHLDNLAKQSQHSKYRTQVINFSSRHMYWWGICPTRPSCCPTIEENLNLMIIDQPALVFLCCKMGAKNLAIFYKSFISLSIRRVRSRPPDSLIPATFLAQFLIPDHTFNKFPFWSKSVFDGQGNSIWISFQTKPKIYSITLDCTTWQDST